MALASLQVGLVSLLQELDCAQGLPTALAGQEPGLHLDQLLQDTQRFASTLVPWKAESALQEQACVRYSLKTASSFTPGADRAYVGL